MSTHTIMAAGRVTPCAPLLRPPTTNGAQGLTRPARSAPGGRCATVFLAGWLAMFGPGGVFAVAAATGDAAARFEAANQLYEQGKFAEAAAAYEAIRQSGVASPALYFNLGNAWFKAAELGRAVAAYRQAAQLTPRDPDVRANLQFARNQVQGPTRHAGRWERWLATLSLNEWTALTAVSLWLTFVALAAVQLKPKLAPLVRNFTCAAAAATLIFGAALALAFTTQDGRKLAVVTIREVTVHNGPFDESPNAFTAHDGAELRVLDRKDNWLQVTDDNRRTGWLKRDAVTVLNES